MSWYGSDARRRDLVSDRRDVGSETSADARSAEGPDTIGPTGGTGRTTQVPQPQGRAAVSTSLHWRPGAARSLVVLGIRRGDG
jgi:hypothetical protein